MNSISTCWFVMAIVSSLRALSDLGDWADSLQYCAMALLAWIVWYLLSNSFPAHIRAQKEDRDAYLKAQASEREDYLREQANARREFRESLAGVTASLNGLGTVMERLLDKMK